MFFRDLGQGPQLWQVSIMGFPEQRVPTPGSCLGSGLVADVELSEWPWRRGHRARRLFAIRHPLFLFGIAPRQPAQTISWIWWNSISGSTMAPTRCRRRCTLAIGTPLARLFFEPQKTMVISSSREKPSRRAAAGGGEQDGGEQGRVDADHRGERADAGNWCQSPCDHGLAEGEVDDHQDRAAVDEASSTRCRRTKCADPGLQQLPGDEGQQELDDDRRTATSNESPTPLTLNSRPTSSGVSTMPKMFEAVAAQTAAGDVAAGDRGEGDRGLHGRGQDGEEEDAAGQRRRQPGGERQAWPAGRAAGTARRCRPGWSDAGANGWRRRARSRATAGRRAGRTAARWRGPWRSRRSPRRGPRPAAPRRGGRTRRAPG